MVCRILAAGIRTLTQPGVTAAGGKEIVDCQLSTLNHIDNPQSTILNCCFAVHPPGLEPGTH